MVTTSISVTENNAERSDDVDILLTPADATRYVTASMFTRSTSTFRGLAWIERSGFLSEKITEIYESLSYERCSGLPVFYVKHFIIKTIVPAKENLVDRRIKLVNLHINVQAVIFFL